MPNIYPDPGIQPLRRRDPGEKRYFPVIQEKGKRYRLQSVRRICEKNGGADSFTYKDGIFTAKVMLHD